MTKAMEAEVLDRICSAIERRAYATNAVDRSSCKADITSAYEYMGLPAPEIVFFDSPIQCMGYLQEMWAGENSASTEDQRIEEISWDSLLAPQTGAADPKDVDITFHGEYIEALEVSYNVGLRNRVLKGVEKRIGKVLEFEHAITKSLEGIATSGGRIYDLYSSGMASYWGKAESFGILQSLVELKALERIPPGCLIAESVLMNCGWIFSMEQVCLVSERPLSITQSISKGAKDPLSKIVWRDQEICTYKYV